jgi:hypothetical protein
MQQGLPWPEAVSNVAPKFTSLEEIKAWRTREAAAGRPSTYEEFCLTHNLCVACLGGGVVYNDNGVGLKVVGMDGNAQLFQRCTACDGTGKAPPAP